MSVVVSTRSDSGSAGSECSNISARPSKATGVPAGCLLNAGPVLCMANPMPKRQNPTQTCAAASDTTVGSEWYYIVFVTLGLDISRRSTLDRVHKWVIGGRDVAGREVSPWSRCLGQ